MIKRKRIFFGFLSTTMATIPVVTLSANLNINHKNINKNIELVPWYQNDIFVYGFNNKGYISIDYENLKKQLIENFKYEILNKNGIKKNNFSISNSDQIIYSYEYKNKKYQKKQIVKGLRISYVSEILKVHKKYIYEAIKKGNFLTKWKYFSIKKISSLPNNDGFIYKITANKSIQKYFIKKGQYFYMGTKIFNNAVQMGEISFSQSKKSHFAKSKAAPYYWNYNDDGSALTNLYIKFNLPNGSGFKVNKIFNIMSIMGKRIGHIDKIKIKTTIKKIINKNFISKKEHIKELSYKISSVEKVWFDKSSSFGAGTFFEGLLGGISTILSAPLNLLTGLIMLRWTFDLDYLYASLDDITQKTSGLTDGVSIGKIKAYNYASFGAAIISLFIPGSQYLSIAKLSARATKIMKVSSLIKSSSKFSNMNKFLNKFKKIINSSLIQKNKFKIKFLDIIKSIYDKNKLIEKTINKLNDEEVKNLMQKIGKELLKKIGKFQMSIFMRDYQEKAIYNEFIKIEDQLTKKGFVIPTNDKIGWVDSLNNPILHEIIRIWFNAHATSFFGKTRVALGFDKNKSQVAFLGQREIIEQISSQSVYNIVKNNVWETQRLFGDKI